MTSPDTAFGLSQEQALLRDSAQRFAEKEYGFDQRKARLTCNPGQQDCWPALADFGWLGLPFSEADAGFGGSLADVAILMRQFGRSLFLEPYLANVVLAGGLLARLGTAEQKARWLAPMIEGRVRLAFAFGEPQSRYRLDDCATRAVPAPGGWTLHGRKTVVPGGASADAFIVLARTGGERVARDGLALLIVERASAGLSAAPFRTYDGHETCDLTLDAVHANQDAALGPVGGAHDEVDRIIDCGAAMACAEAVGVLEALFEDTLAYLKERRQFGQPLATNQALQHRLVDMRIQLREAQAMAAEAVDALLAADAASSNGVALRQRAVSAAKVHVGQALRLLGQEAVQLHGAIGTTDDVRISHHFKRATFLSMLFGDVDWHRRRFGELLRADLMSTAGETA